MRMQLNTILTNYPVIKCHQTVQVIIVFVINYPVIKCKWLIVAW